MDGGCGEEKVLIYDFEHENYPILLDLTQKFSGDFEGQCKGGLWRDLRISPVIFVGGLR